jgi:alkaline phosphatase
VLLIGDGMGAAYWTAARFASAPLSVERCHVMGLVDTRSASAWITDSAAGATAYASGVRTFNGAIGVGPDSLPVPTVLEMARDRGWATGLVVTSSVTHATPAAFVAHVPSREEQFEIASELVASGVDVFLGGGASWFDASSRPDGRDLLGEVRADYALVRNAGELGAVDLEATTRLAGLFADNHMPPAADRTPSLPEMTRTALAVLDHDPDGFFLMVEGSQPDFQGHANAALDDVVAEVLDFDAAVGVVLDYADRHPETLVVVLADHETGGLAIETTPDSLLARGEPVRPWADYTSTGHTAQMVPLFAAGAGAAAFGGIRSNFEVGQLLQERVSR